MEVVRQYVDANLLKSVIPLSRSMHDKRLEIIVLPAEDTKVETKSDKDIDRIVNSLIGAIPDMGMNLEDFREERLRKYEIVD